MTEKGREIWLAFVTIIGGGILAYYKIITGDQWIQLALIYGGGSTLVRTLYKGFKYPNGNGKPVEAKKKEEVKNES
jgi:hypothetical protein